MNDNLSYESIKAKISQKFDDYDSALLADVVYAAELKGKKSHGILRIDHGILDSKPNGKPTVNKTSGNTAQVDGKNNPGMLALQYGLNQAIEILKTEKIAIVGTNNTHTTSGYLGYYAKKMADLGYINIVMARSDAAIAGFGAKLPMFGTNPIAYGIPNKKGERSLVFDMGTSVMSFGEIIGKRNAGETLPEGIAFDKLGNATTNPQDVIDDGSILPFDKGYKGSGLALLVEILAGIFVGASSGNNSVKVENDWGNLIIAMKKDIFISENQFDNSMVNLIKFMRTQIQDNGRLPGDPK